MRLEGADWNDGLDMAKERGESVAFSCMYAQNLGLLASLLEKSGRQEIKVASELKILLGNVDYNSAKTKQALLQDYFSKTKSCVSGDKINIDGFVLARDLRERSAWMMRHIRKQEWLKEGFFNGYYDNKGLRVEGKNGRLVRIMLATQVFAIMSRAADEGQVAHILKNAQKYLWDKLLGSYHLNSDFKEEQLDLGRAFSFIYGDKENGAIFSHMVVMFAYGLYKRGFIDAGWQALSSLYKLAINTNRSKIYPCLPEYFNAEGRGMYAYLTGSASWFILTMLTQVFGVRGENGDLLIEPKLTPELFRNSTKISLNRTFAGYLLHISFFNPKRKSFGKYRIINASLNGRDLPLSGTASLLLPRKTLQKLASGKAIKIEIILG